MLAALILVTSPTAGHALARAAHRTGLAAVAARLQDGEGVVSAVFDVVLLLLLVASRSRSRA